MIYVQSLLPSDEVWESDWGSDEDSETRSQRALWSTPDGPCDVMDEFPPLRASSSSDVTDCSRTGQGWVCVVDKRKHRLCAPSLGPGLLSQPVPKTKVKFDTPGQLEIVKVKAKK